MRARCHLKRERGSLSTNPKTGGLLRVAVQTRPLTSGHTIVILKHMKTAVSIPDDVYEQAERTARQLGVPRSRLITQALREFLRNHEASQVTQRLNEVIEETRPDETMDNVSVESLRQLTRDDTW